MESSFVFVRRAREKLGLTQAEFAKRLDLHRSTINRYENGERLPLHARMAIERLLEMESHHETNVSRNTRGTRA